MKCTISFHRLLAVCFLLMAMHYHLTAQNTAFVLTKKQAVEDFKWLRFSLEYTHPRLYKYDSKQTVDARFDSICRAIGNTITGLDFLALVTSANAKVHCGHLYTIAQDSILKEVAAKKVLPFYVRLVNGELYLFNDCSNAGLPNGAHILSINGKKGTAIVQALLAGIAADGYIQTRKMKLLERYYFTDFQGFDLYYYLFADRHADFTIEYEPPGTNAKKTIQVQGITPEQRKHVLLQRYRIDERAWFNTPSPTFTIAGNGQYAILTVSRSFHDKTIDPDFDSLVASAFRLLNERKIAHLVLDLRNNEGGEESQQMTLMSYLYNQPFRLYQNIYLSHLDFRPLKPVIKERDTARLLFNNDDSYIRKINDDLWINDYEYDDNLQLKPPKEDVFTGRLYVLMNGTCFSSAADLIADLKKTTNAIFIGEESGGTFEGPTGGNEIVIQLPNSKIMVRISPNLQIGALYQQHPLGRGVLPTHPIQYTVADILQHKDLEMEFAKKLIEKSLY